MDFLRRIGFILALLLFFTTVFAYTEPLSSFGLNTISLTIPSTKQCKEIIVNLPDNAKMEVGSGILSINADFDLKQNDNTYVSISINGGKTNFLWPENFACKDTCWARLFVPEIKNGETKINLCVALGGETKGITVKDTSFIGIFDTPVLLITNSAPESIFLGQRARMEILVSNIGTKDTNVFVQFVHPDTRAGVIITSFDIVEGDSSGNALISPGETKSFVFYIKPSIISSYNLPSAALFFTNIFGENQVLLSNHPIMLVKELVPLELSLIKLNDSSPYSFKAVIKNNQQAPFDGELVISPKEAFALDRKTISVSPNSEKEFLFTTNNLPVGKYSFFVMIQDGNKIFNSNTINIEETQAGIPISIILAVFGVLIGALIFVWIYFVKEK